jgi:hypothetical protein
MAASAFQQSSIEHIKRLGRLLDQGGVGRVKRVYDQAQAELERKIARHVGRGSAPYTVHQHRALLAQVRQGQMEIARRMGDASAQATIDTQTDALHSLIRNVKSLEKKHGSGGVISLPIEEASRFHGIIDKRKTSLLKQNRQSMATYGSGVVKKIENQLGLSLATGESTGEAVERVQKTADMEFWRAERIVRTEQAWAYNATHRDGIEAASVDVPDMYMRWTELVDDDSLEPLDDRVGADSIALHGQVAKPGEMFKMPASALLIVIETRYGKSKVSHDLIGKSWAHPPNRPHDRAVIQAWRPGWEVPGWHLVGGSKVNVKPPRRRTP